MSEKPTKGFSRRDFLKGAALATGAALLPNLPVAAASKSAASKVFSPPNLQSAKKVRLAVGGWAQQNVEDLLKKTDFTKQTGIDVEIVLRADTKETELTRIASALQADTTPYDVIDFEDELTTSLSRAGYVIGLDDILPKDLWDDFSPEMIAYTKTWSTYNDETFRVIHNWEMPYWFYRKDWFDAKKVDVPTSWEEVSKMGEVFTDEGKSVWATEDGLIKGAFLNVYLAWVTLQAGGNPFEVGDAYKQALQYTYDLMHTNKTMNPASLQTDYNTQNADYLADKVAFMRQWPFFGDVARGKDNEKWFSEDKVAVALPPVGPGGKEGSTYAAGWGFGILKNSPNEAEAKELLKFLVDSKTAVEAMKVGFWFLNSRKSVLAEAPKDNWLVQAMKTYTDAGVIGVRPFHPQFVEALTILEDTASAFLSKQTKIEEAMEQAKTQLAALGETAAATEAAK